MNLDEEWSEFQDAWQKATESQGTDASERAVSAAERIIVQAALVLPTSPAPARLGPLTWLWKVPEEGEVSPESAAVRYLVYGPMAGGRVGFYVREQLQFRNDEDLREPHVVGERSIPWLDLDADTRKAAVKELYSFVEYAVRKAQG